MPVISNLPEAMQRLDALMHKRIIKIVARYERNLQEMFRLAKTGAIYRRGSKTHQASAPGEAPAIDTGGLSQNIAHEIKQVSLGQYKALIGVTRVIPIGRVLALELGTLDGRIKKRPAWVPAVRQLRQQVKEF